MSIIIAIDGYSSTGKSTTAKAVAQALGYVYIDTGAMYRAVTYLALEKGFASTSGIEVKALMKVLRKTDIKFVYNATLGFSEIYLDGKNIENEIRGIEIANWVSEVAKQPEVRTYLVNLQRKMGEQKGIVMDGRDIGTTVFPNAELKIFMTASEQVRAERRYKELKTKGDNASFEEVLANIQHRDHIDTTRKESPLRKADDAVVIDNTHLTIEEQVQKILSLMEKYQ
jgi:cytidylate kinase